MKWYINWIKLRINTIKWMFAQLIRNEKMTNRVNDEFMKIVADQYYLKYGERIK